MNDLPHFLSDFKRFKSHLEIHFRDLGPNEKGSAFADLVEKIVPFTEAGRKFETISQSEKTTYDKGVDLSTGINDRGHQLCVQAKYSVRGKDDIDQIISKFRDYEQQMLGTSNDIQKSFPIGDEDSDPTLVFMIVTAPSIELSLEAYEKSKLTSGAYYDQLQDQGRIEIVDGPELLRILQGLYRKNYIGPPELVLNSVRGWTQHGSVWLGTVLGKDLARLYRKHGDGLFFENIRSFLGGQSVSRRDRETVNERIIDTIRNHPEKMLERNNGIVLKSSNVIEERDSIQLENAAVVNGCQTTVCLYQCLEGMSDSCLVPVKVVITDQGWEIAHAANYQNEVSYIDLELARWLRPQAVEKAASDTGYAVEGFAGPGTDVSSILGHVHRRHVEYEEVRHVYIGLFSRSPSQLFAHNYSKLRADVLEEIYQHPDVKLDIYQTIFDSVVAGKDAQEEVENLHDAEVIHPFKRLGEKASYRSYLVILALCGALSVQLSNRKQEAEEEAERMRKFFTQARTLLDNRTKVFVISYRHAYAVVAERAMDQWEEDSSLAKVQQNMASRVRSAAFEALYRSLQMRLSNDRSLGAKDELGLWTLE